MIIILRVVVGKIETPYFLCFVLFSMVLPTAADLLIFPPFIT
jgi:hypothetical protein